MGLITRDTGSGLVVAEQGADEARLQHDLKQIDDRLVLLREVSAEYGCWVWKVVYRVSDDLPAEFICTWCDRHGRPLPLSSGLVALVQSLRPEARARRGPDADQRNEQLKALRAKQREDDLRTVSDEHRAKVERGQVSVSMGPRTPLPSWLRTSRPGRNHR